MYPDNPVRWWGGRVGAIGTSACQVTLRWNRLLDSDVPSRRDMAPREMASLALACARDTDGWAGRAGAARASGHDGLRIAQSADHFQYKFIPATIRFPPSTVEMVPLMSSPALSRMQLRKVLPVHSPGPLSLLKQPGR